MTILSAIFVVFLIIIMYWLYKLKDNCGWNPFCYVKKSFDAIDTCKFDPTCYYKKLKE